MEKQIKSDFSEDEISAICCLNSIKLKNSLKKSSRKKVIKHKIVSKNKGHTWSKDTIKKIELTSREYKWPKYIFERTSREPDWPKDILEIIKSAETTMLQKKNIVNLLN
jgi:hypothetical protein